MLYYEIDPSIRLKLIEPHHKEALFAAIDANRDHLRPWFPWVDVTKSADDSLGFITGALQAFGNYREMHLCIWEKGEIVGVVGFNSIDRNKLTAEIGYWLVQSAQRRGIMTRACRAIIDYAIDEWQLNRIIIRAESSNRPSCAVAERLGFTHEGTLRQSLKRGDQFFDLELYSLLASEWRTTI